MLLLSPCLHRLQAKCSVPPKRIQLQMPGLIFVPEGFGRGLRMLSSTFESSTQTPKVIGTGGLTSCCFNTNQERSWSMQSALCMSTVEPLHRLSFPRPDAQRQSA